VAEELRVQKNTCWDCVCRSFPALLRRGRALTIKLLLQGVRWVLGASVSTLECTEASLSAHGQGQDGAFTAGKVSPVASPGTGGT